MLAARPPPALPASCPARKSSTSVADQSEKRRMIGLKLQEAFEHERMGGRFLEPRVSKHTLKVKLEAQENKLGLRLGNNIVMAVEHGSPAGRSGVEQYDHIVAIDGAQLAKGAQASVLIAAELGSAPAEMTISVERLYDAQRAHVLQEVAPILASRIHKERQLTIDARMLSIQKGLAEQLRKEEWATFKTAWQWVKGIGSTALTLFVLFTTFPVSLSCYAIVGATWVIVRTWRSSNHSNRHIATE